jgi:hypothetical protein
MAPNVRVPAGASGTQREVAVKGLVTGSDGSIAMSIAMQDGQRPGWMRTWETRTQRVGVLLLAAACSSKHPGYNDSVDRMGGAAGNPGAGGSPGGAPGAAGGSGELAPLALNGCNQPSDYEDLTAPSADRIIDWTFGAQNCSKIRVGQSVTWSGNFTTHPLEPWQGDAANPIESYTGGASDHAVVFDVSGTFGYRCAVHTTTMFGAIWVVP